MGKRRYYQSGPIIPVLWKNIAIAVLAVAVLGVVVYIFVV